MNAEIIVVGSLVAFAVGFILWLHISGRRNSLKKHENTQSEARNTTPSANAPD
ncbi:MAG TPA: hypothetical protein VGQ81_14365 [Acidobacteriota bacterium]|jgi:hypothetical protein|nr:hypothetical protein [Acidobacteriota bacterium]